MSKVNSPILSFKAHGTIGDTLTMRQRKSATIAERKPIPSDPQSFLQLYQRWLYKDAFYYWATLSTAQKAVYKALGNSTNNTTIGAFLKEYLLAPPDIVGLYRMDSLSGTSVLDYSGRGHHATNFGTIDAPGIVTRARGFDGVNDYLKIPAHPDFELPGPLTIEFVFKRHTAPAAVQPQFFIRRMVDGILVQTQQNLAMVFRAKVAGVLENCLTPAGIATLNTWHYGAAFYDNVAMQFTLDHTDYTGDAAVGDIYQEAVDSDIGSIGGIGWSALDGDIDIEIIWNRALSQEQRRYHAERYGIPPP